MTAVLLRTTEGTPVVLGERLGRGGEGTVWMVANASRLALKLYHDRAADREARLDALIHASGSGASPAIAWPRRRVLDQSGATVGFLMEAFPDARPIHELYTPLSRRTHFPAANQVFLVRVALNLAKVVARLHRDGFVIGDLNHSSVLVVPDATVRLVDADSFPLPPDFVCRVGTPEYMPADLHGMELGSVRRRSDHDVFALSVLIYQLLFGGRHPFAGYGGRPGANVADNIVKVRRYRLPGRRRTELSAMLAGDRGPEAVGLFEQVFSRRSANDASASRWAGILACR